MLLMAFVNKYYVKKLFNSIYINNHRNKTPIASSSIVFNKIISIKPM